MKKKTKKKTKKINIKEGYKKGKAIIEALEEGDKKELKKSTYVCYDDVIEFPKPVAFTIKRLKEVIREVEKYKGDGLLVGIQIEIPMEKVPKELKKYAKKGKKIFATKTKEIK
jgi:hypothetical protein